MADTPEALIAFHHPSEQDLAQIGVAVALIYFVARGLFVALGRLQGRLPLKKSQY